MKTRFWIADSGPFGTAIKKRCAQLKMKQMEYAFRVIGADLAEHIPSFRQFYKHEIERRERIAKNRKEALK
jgi:hypothetical protein